MLYNPAIMQHQNFMFQRNNYSQNTNGNTNGQYQYANLPANHMHMQNFANKTYQQNTQAVTASNKQPAKNSKEQGSNKKTNVITDTFIKPITNYIIPNLYSSRLESHNQNDMKTKDEITRPTTNQITLKIIENKTSSNNNSNASSNNNNNNNTKTIAAPLTTTSNQQLRLHANPKQSNNEPVNSIKLILNNKKHEQTIATVSPTNKISTRPNEQTTVACYPKTTNLKSPTGNQQSSPSKPNQSVSPNHKTQDNSNYPFVLHEKVVDTKRTKYEPGKVFTTINELEASLPKIPISMETAQGANAEQTRYKKNYTQGENRKALRFKTIHVEPSAVREAAERNKNPDSSTAKPTSSPKNGSTNYNYDILANKNTDKHNNLVKDFLAVEKEINSFYGKYVTTTQAETKPNNKVCIKTTTTATHDPESMQSSLNSVLSMSSQNNGEQQANTMLQALPTSGYSSFNSQQSNKPKISVDVDTTHQSSPINQQQQRAIIPTTRAHVPVSACNETKAPHVVQTTEKTAISDTKQPFLLKTGAPSVEQTVVENLIKTFGTTLNQANSGKTDSKTKTSPANNTTTLTTPATATTDHISRATKNKLTTNTGFLQNHKSPVRIIKIQRQIVKPDRKSKSQEPNQMASALDKPLSAFKPIESKTGAKPLLLTSDVKDVSALGPAKPPAEQQVTEIDKESSKIPVGVDGSNSRRQQPIVTNNDLKKANGTTKQYQEMTKMDSQQQTTTKPNKIPIKIRSKPDKSIKIHHGIPPPPVVVSKPPNVLQLRSKHISISPTKRKSLFENEKLKLMTNRSTSNQVQDVNKYDKFKEDLLDGQSRKKNDILETERLIKQIEQKSAELQQNTYANTPKVDPKANQPESQQPYHDLKNSCEKKPKTIPFYQQKYGTLQAPNRRMRHSIFNQGAMQMIRRIPYDSYDKSYSIIEETGNNPFNNKTNLPNLNGVDYYYKSRNENKFVEKKISILSIRSICEQKNLFSHYQSQTLEQLPNPKKNRTKNRSNEKLFQMK
jgi:hypothetical protein